MPNMAPQMSPQMLPQSAPQMYLQSAPQMVIGSMPNMVYEAPIIIQEVSTLPPKKKKPTHHQPAKHHVNKNQGRNSMCFLVRK